MLQTYQRNGKARLAATIASVIVIAGIVVLADHLKAKGSTPSSATVLTTPTVANPNGNTGVMTPSTSSGPSSSPNTATTSPVSNSKDGSYSATTDYQVPHGGESIAVSVTLKGGVITDASVQNSENDPTSASFQEDFASLIKRQVVGQKISGLQIGVVAGASDTSQAFNEAISQIANKAQA